MERIILKTSLLGLLALGQRPNTEGSLLALRLVYQYVGLRIPLYVYKLQLCLTLVFRWLCFV